VSSPLSFLIQSLECSTFHLFVESLDEFAFVNVLALCEIQWLGFGGDHLGSAKNPDCLASFAVFERDLTNNGDRWLSGLDLRSLFNGVDFNHSLLKGAGDKD